MKWNILAYGLIITLLIYGLFFLENPVKPTQSINTVTQVVPEKPTIDKESIAKKISNKKKEVREKTNWLEGYDKENDHTPEVGLIQAFREFRKLKRCRVIILATANGNDSYQAFLSSINRKKRIKLANFTAKQHQFFDKWSNSCLDLLEYDGELYTAAHERYRKRFYQTKPKTTLEKDFAKSWPLKEETQYIDFKYRTLMAGYDENNKKQNENIQRYLRKVSGMLGYININDDIEFSSRTTNEIAMYEKQATEIKGIIDGSIYIDKEYLANLSSQHNNQIKLANDFLKQNTSSEAFLTIAPIIFSYKNKEMGIYDRFYFYQLIQPVYQLYACTMDADCSDLSKFMVAACFKTQNNDDSACGKGIEEHYLNYYFSPNQLMDIDLLLTYFFDNYAQN